MAENALLKVLLDEGSHLSVDGMNSCGIEAGLGTVLSRPVCVLSFSQVVKAAALSKMQRLLDKALATGTPLLLLFSEKEKSEVRDLALIQQRIIRLSGVCPIIALLEKDAGEVAKLLLPFADFRFYASGMHERTSCDVQALDLPGAIEGLRTLLSFFPLNCAENAPLLQVADNNLSTLQANASAQEIIVYIADGSAKFELYRDTTTQLSFARVGGRSVGVIACAQSELPAHAARFIQFCDCYALPVVFVTEQPLSLYPMQLFMLAQATIPKVCLGPTGSLASLFDIRIGIEGTQDDVYDILLPAHAIRMQLINALELLSVKRDVLPPHKHGNLPV